MSKVAAERGRAHTMSHSSIPTPSERPSTGEPTESERHELLSSRRRRVVLDVLADRPDGVDLADLATLVAGRGGTDDDDRVRLTLHHAHLPKLDAHGVVEYDRESNRVEPVEDRVPL